MSFRTHSAREALEEINGQTTVSFQEMTSDFDLFETAVAEYDGIFCKYFFPTRKLDTRNSNCSKTTSH